MKVLLHAVDAGVRGAADRAQLELLDAAALSDAERQLAAERPAVVVVGGASPQDVASACRRLRSIEVTGEILFVAQSTGLAHDVQALIEAGADDFFVPSDGADALAARLLVARSSAIARASRRAVESERLLFFDLSLQLLCTAGFDGYFKSVNAAWTKALGWSAAELLATPLLDRVHAQDRERTRAAFARLEHGEALTDFSHRFACPDGSYRWLQWEATSAIGPRLIYAAVRDVTDARSAADALLALTENVSTTLDSIGDGVISTDLRGAVTRMNPVAEGLCGYSLFEAEGMPLAKILPLVDEGAPRTVVHPVARALRDERAALLPSACLLLRRDGSSMPIEQSCAPIRSAAGDVSGTVLVFRDLTAQRQAEEAQKALQKQLVFTDRMTSIGTLAAGVAHEINNPLTYMQGNVELAIEEVRGLGAVAPANRPERLNELEALLLEAQEGVRRVTKIVRGLKTFARVEDERRVPIDLRAVLETSASMTANEIQPRARLMKEYGPVPLVLADEARLGQVFVNLLVNAAHAFPSGNVPANTIRIASWTAPDGRAVVEIHDNGRGIPDSDIGRIFDPFFTTKPVGSGTGLGLSISHNIVRAMGGELSVHSEVGRGSAFRVTLPPCSASVSTARPEDAPAMDLDAEARPVAVLVVDDEVSVGVVVQRLLRGHQVTVTTGVREALDLLAADRDFDVVLCDLMMPELSGMDFHSAVLERYPRLAPRIVFVTGGAFTPEAEAFLKRTGNERLDKPFAGHQLRAVVEARGRAARQSSSG